MRSKRKSIEGLLRGDTLARKPVPLHAWKPEHGRDRLKVIEDDIRNLMRQVAETKFALSEEKRQHTDNTRKLLLSMIEVMDGFERLFNNINSKKDKITPQMKIWIGNFRAVCRLLNNAVASQGVSKIENLDLGFDPKWHRIAQTVVDPTKADGTIVGEEAKGYVWQTEILRKSEVAVVRNAPEGEAKTHESAASDSTASSTTEKNQEDSTDRGNRRSGTDGDDGQR